MFENKSVLEIFHIGGWVMYILLACSVLSLAVFIGKEIEFWRKSKPKRVAVMKHVRELLERGEIDATVAYCRSWPRSVFCSVIAAGLSLYSKGLREVEDATNREITVEIAKFESRTAIVGTIANLAVYIGLLGTVLGIVNAFHGVSMSATAGLNAVIRGVAEALINTAAGLGVAIPAVVFFNIITRRIKSLTNEMDAVASELVSILDTNGKNQ